MQRLRAFTLIEVLITLAILSISLLAIFKGNIFNLKSSKVASDLTTAVIAAEMLMKEAIGAGYPESGVVNGEFEDGLFEGLKWTKSVETMELPMAVDLKVVTIEVRWGKDRSYQLKTIISRQ
jgi:prepilin-type N-terminal cleavage/methylation domain-containing protein